MTTLLKATRVTGEPLVLVRAKSWFMPEPAEATEPPGEITPLPPDVDSIAAERATRDAKMAEYEQAIRHQVAVHEEYRRRVDAELADLEQEARAKGFEQGSAEGREQERSRYAEQLKALGDVLACARAALDQAIDGMAEIGIEVVHEAIAKIVGEAMIEREVVVSTVREVIRKAKDRTRLVARVAPSDWSLLEGSRDVLTEGLSVGSIELVADERVQLGGCLLETSAGDLDGRLEAQLEQLREVLKRAALAPGKSEAGA